MFQHLTCWSNVSTVEDKCVSAQQFSVLGGYLHIIVCCGWIHNTSTHKVHISVHVISFSGICQTLWTCEYMNLNESVCYVTVSITVPYLVISALMTMHQLYCYLLSFPDAANEIYIYTRHLKCWCASFMNAVFTHYCNINCKEQSLLLICSQSFA